MNIDDIEKLVDIIIEKCQETFNVDNLQKLIAMLFEDE